MKSYVVPFNAQYRNDLVGGMVKMPGSLSIRARSKNEAVRLAQERLLKNKSFPGGTKFEIKEAYIL